MKNLTGFKLSYAILSAAFILCGIVMLIIPEIFMYTFCYITGAVFLVKGIIRLTGYFSKDLYKIAFQFDLALGVASVILGLIIIFNSDGFLRFIPTVIGIFTLISGAFRIQSAIDAKKFGLSKWWVMLLGSVITVLAGLILILWPSESMVAIVGLIGITIIIDGIQNLFLLFYAVK